jgi:hypothetical protein
MFASKLARPQTKTAAGSTNGLRRQDPNLTARPFSSDAVEQASILQEMIGNRGGPAIWHGALRIRLRSRMANTESP